MPVMLQDPRFFSEQDIEEFKKPIQAAAKKVAALNPAQKKVRSSKEIKNEMRRLVGEAKDSVHGDEGELPRFRRQLAQAKERLADRKNLLNQLTSRVRFLRDTPGLPASQVRAELQKLEGHSYRDRYEQQRRQPGSIDSVTDEIATLESNVTRLKTAVSNVEARVAKEMPRLEAELKEAIRVERALA